MALPNERGTPKKPVRTLGVCDYNVDMDSRHHLWVLLIAFWLPPLVFTLVPPELTHPLWAYGMGATFGFVAWVAYRGRFTLRELGVVGGNARVTLLANLLATVALAAAMAGFREADAVRQLRPPTLDLFYLPYALLLSPAQEFAYRGLLVAALRRRGIRSPWMLLAVSSVTYASAHAIFRDPLTVILALLVGLLWGAIFLKTNDLWGVSVSHAVVGSLSIYFGIT